MRSLTLALCILLSSATGFAFAADLNRDVSQYNMTDGALRLQGYDPVSYFPEGGGTPALGKAELQMIYGGLPYRFSSPANADLFLQNPAKYEPTYGSWCAYAMASGSKINIDPRFFTIHGNRLHFFVSNRAKLNFDRDVAGHEATADPYWKQFSGENPRL